MVLSFYKRYVPPAKDQTQQASLTERPAKKRKVEIKLKRGRVGSTSEENGLGHGEIVQHVESNDTSSQLNLDEAIDKKRNKKRKKQHLEEQGANAGGADEGTKAPQRSASQDGRVNGDEFRNGDHASVAENHVEPKRERKRKKKKEREAADENDDPKPGPDDVNAKHKKLLSRYARDAEVTTEETVQDGFEDAVPPEFHGLEPLPQPAPAEEGLKASISAALPQWLRDPVTVNSSASVHFKDLSLNPQTVETLGKQGYSDALAIQSAVIPLLQGSNCHNRDLCISAATGSGKTLAYALPLIEALQGKHGHHLRGLIVVPTRELVAQAQETLEMCKGGADLRIVTAVGSKTLAEEQAALVTERVRYDPQQYRIEQAIIPDEDEELMKWDVDDVLREKSEVIPDHVIDYQSKADILICTPGRLVEHIKSTKGFTLECVQWLIIDEADRLLDESFQDWVDTLVPQLEYLPPLDGVEEKLQMSSPILRQRIVQKVILSATMTRDVGKLMALKLRRPKLVVMAGDRGKTEHANDEGEEVLELPATLTEYAVPIEDSSTKPLALLKIMGTPLPDALPSSDHPQPSPLGTESVDKDPSSTSDPSATPHTNTQSSTPSPPLHGTLIFTHNNESALRLSHLLSLLSPPLTPHLATLTKSTTSSSSLKLLRQFRQRRLTTLIASDRASRGLDIPNLARVINYDVPSSVVSYVHRVGRTARAGRRGVAVTMVEGFQGRWFWREVARGEGVRRGSVGRRGEGDEAGNGESRPPGVRRWNLSFHFEDEEMERYEEAVKKLGEEAMGRGGK